MTFLKSLNSSGEPLGLGELVADIKSTTETPGPVDTVTDGRADTEFVTKLLRDPEAV